MNSQRMKDMVSGLNCVWFNCFDLSEQIYSLLRAGSAVQDKGNKQIIESGMHWIEWNENNCIKNE